MATASTERPEVRVRLHRMLMLLERLSERQGRLSVLRADDEAAIRTYHVAARRARYIGKERDLWRRMEIGRRRQAALVTAILHLAGGSMDGD